MSRRLVRLTSRVRRCASSSETFRLTVASGIPSLRDADDRLPASTAASSVDMALSLSIRSFHYPEGWLHDLPNAGSQWKGLCMAGFPGASEHDSATGLFERYRLHGIDQSGAGPQRLARGLSADGGGKAAGERGCARTWGA